MRSEAVLGSPRKSQEVPGSPRLGSLAWCEGTSGIATRRTSFGGNPSAMGMMLRVQCLPGAESGDASPPWQPLNYFIANLRWSKLRLPLGFLTGKSRNS